MLRQLKPGKASAFVGWQHEHRCHQGMAELAGVPEAAGSSVRKPGTEYGDDARNGKRGGHGRRAGDDRRDGHGRRAGLGKHGGHG